MKVVKRELDIAKWKTCSQLVIQPHIHEIVASALKNPDEHYYRGGFGRLEDYELLLKTGTDYESGYIKTETGEQVQAVYASPLSKVGSEPWCRGLDPLYWALRGNGFSEPNGWNKVNSIVAYSIDNLLFFRNSDIIAFKRSPLEAISAVIELEFDKSQPAFK